MELLQPLLDLRCIDPELWNRKQAKFAADRSSRLSFDKREIVMVSA
jgi:hypothetical protein